MLSFEVILSCVCLRQQYYFFFLNDPATTEIYTLSLHDALPISQVQSWIGTGANEPIPPDAISQVFDRDQLSQIASQAGVSRSEEHTSELQSRQYLVCRLLLEKKKKN